jgi:hypothetical protein
MKNSGFRALFLLLTLAFSAAWADEGMWLFNQFPKDRVKQKYGFEVTDRFLDHLRLSSVKMGASGSFVSPHGLVFTNHHVGLSCVQKVSSTAHNYVADGFLAATQAQEIRCPGMELSVLEKIDDVTAKVKAAVKAPEASAEANQQRKAAITGIEQACTSSTGRRCEVVTLYAGARYTSISTSATQTSGWSSRRSTPSAFSGAIPTTSPTRATAWMSRFSAPMRTAVRPTHPNT